MARPTNDPKESVIKIRINDETRSFIERGAKERGVNMSEFLREILNSAMQNKNNAMQNEDYAMQNPLIADIEQTIQLQGEDSDEFFKVLNRKLNEYEIVFDGTEIKVG